MSQFKFKCFSCGEMINRGDKITRCIRGSPTGMVLRYRGGDSRNGLTMAETAFYQAETGKDMWVHIGCIPCYWDSLPEDCNEYSRPKPKLRPICTDWGIKVYGEWEKLAADDEAWERMGVPYFCMVKGYPMEKFMRDRIIHAVTRFQALWRGYIYKKAYLIALQQQREQRARARYALYQEMLRTSPDLGDHVEILFNRGEPSEAIYSGEVYETQYRGDWVKIKVKFHYDGEVRKYTGKKFKILKKECEEHKKKLGIEAKLTGRLNTARVVPQVVARIGRIVFPNSPSIQDWRYHYPDATPVQ
jgi:hypothetical protein